MPLAAVSTARADEVYIRIDMNGDVDVTINHSNGTFAIYYNGRDLLKEIERQYREIEALRTAMVYLSVKAQAYDELQPEIEELNQTINQMIKELNLIINDLYGGLDAIYRMVGIPGNSSAIRESIIAGNATVIGYLERYAERIDGLNSEMQALRGEMLKLHLELLKEMEERNKALEAEMQAQIRVLNASMTQRMEQLSADYQRQVDLLSLSLTQMQQHFLYVIASFVAFSVIVILLTAMRRP